MLVVQILVLMNVRVIENMHMAEIKKSIERIATMKKIVVIMKEKENFHVVTVVVWSFLQMHISVSHAEHKWR